MNRRSILKVAVTAAAPLAVPPALALCATTLSRPSGSHAFAALSEQEALQGVFGDPPDAVDDGLAVEAPLKTDGKRVPVTISWSGPTPLRVALLAAPSRQPLCAVLTPATKVLAFRTLIRMSRSGTISAYASGPNQLRSASASVVVTVGGYGMSYPDTPAPQKRYDHSMETRVRARAVGAITKLIAYVGQVVGASEANRAPGGTARQRRLCFVMDGIELARVDLGSTALDHSFVGLTLGDLLRGRELVLTWIDEDGQEGTASTIVA